MLSDYEDYWPATKGKIRTMDYYRKEIAKFNKESKKKAPDKTAIAWISHCKQVLSDMEEQAERRKLSEGSKA